ncbi:hypothetical protein [Haloprofundus salilacus]|uniref:hypothetical protein n=1 Tax=Haloprofundus salilacus TaxID=2876190 RepID=UPI001CD02495|nr:hypothetical protein [Haloprofundus salilacus]
MIRSLVNQYPNEIQLPLVFVGYQLSLVYAQQLFPLTPQLETVPLDAVSAELYDWSTVQFGLALVVLGLALSNQSVLHRNRVLRLSWTQRLVALSCALLLMSPWLTAIVAGIALGFRDPFTTLWFVAFLGGFVGVGGTLLVGITQVVQVYGTWSDRFPYVGVNMSRREVARGGIFTLLVGVAIAITFAAGRVP